MGRLNLGIVLGPDVTVQRLRRLAEIDAKMREVADPDSRIRAAMFADLQLYGSLALYSHKEGMMLARAQYDEEAIERHARALGAYDPNTWPSRLWAVSSSDELKDCQRLMLPGRAAYPMLNAMVGHMEGDVELEIRRYRLLDDPKSKAELTFALYADLGCGPARYRLSVSPGCPGSGTVHVVDRGDGVVRKRDEFAAGIGVGAVLSETLPDGLLGFLPVQSAHWWVGSRLPG